MNNKKNNLYNKITIFFNGLLKLKNKFILKKI
jgi:hypothetical protein